MLKKILILLFIFSFFYFWVFALSDEQKWSILNSFKERQFDLLFESTTWEITPEEKSLFNISKKINLYWNIEDNIYDARQNYENRLVENMEKISDLEEQIKSLEEDIENSTKRIGNINTKVIDVKKEISFSETTIELLKTKIDENKEILLKYLVYLYKKWNIVSWDFNDIDNLKSIILNSNNISDIINDLYFKWLIQITWKKLIDKHRDYISRLYIKKIDLEKQEDLLKNLRKNLILNRKIIDDKMEFKKEILATSKWKQALYEKFIGDKLELEKSIKLKAFQEKIKFENIKDWLLEKYWCEFIDFWSNTVWLRTISDTCLTLNKMIYAESKLRWFDTDSNNIFSWPVNPIYGLSAYFHDNEYKELFWATHDAIDIIIEQWTSIQAPADWYVMFIELPKTPDYSYMALKHSDGFVTVFWHLSDILVEEYDYVTRWQIIAKTGWEYWTNWAWYITTWPHLHFEVYRNQEYVDPLNFLSLAELPYKYLLEKYNLKYMIDFKEKKWYDFNHLDSNTRVFKLDWNSEIERQKSLIQKYAVWDFKNWQMWVDESLDGNIDPTFLMCIWLAETWLWRNMKTQYNVWNIWNTDSWATKQFFNARSWVYWMVKTLNNKYLWNYNAIKDLSRYWNKDWQIYASSSDHWHNNIIKCMTNIKWYYVPDNYNFRIMK